METLHRSEGERPNLQKWTVMDRGVLMRLIDAPKLWNKQCRVTAEKKRREFDASQLGQKLIQVSFHSKHAAKPFKIDPQP